VLLIITNRHDIACDYLIVRLKERGVPFSRLNTDTYPHETAFDILLTSTECQYHISLSNKNKVIPGEITSVYFRQPIPPKVESALSLEEKEFAETEHLEFLRSLWRVIPEEVWFNHPKKIWGASNKVEQLLKAKSFGLKIPDTLVSFRKPAIAEFISRHPRVIAKAVRHGFFQSNDKVMLAGTQRIPENYIEIFDSFANVPMIYQEEIIKHSELRVVVVGKNCFATKITEKSGSNVDWRISQLNGNELEHERYDLPEDVKQKCLALVNSFKLNYSAMDLIKASNGEYYFLELNPNGQWAWIEQLTEYPIRDAIIDLLKETHGRS
jgi:glutathione synthase/RimK-type ligase-like ATP-grasp enzyme